MNIQAQSKSIIKAYEFKKFNRSITNHYCSDKIADKFMTVLPQKIKPNFLSLIGLFVILIGFALTYTLQSSRIVFGLETLFLFVYQLMDNVNQKQALRRSQASLLTIYFDHVCDSLSGGFIALTIGRLLGFSNTSIWYILLFFNIAPNYLQHLRMYYSDEMRLEAVNVVDQGLIIMQLLCILGTLFGHGLYRLNLFNHFHLNHLLFFVFILALIPFTIQRIRGIVEHNLNQGSFKLKNLFILIVMGLVMLETAVMVQTSFKLITVSLCLQITFLLASSLMVGRLIIDGGSKQFYKQIQVDNYLLTIGTIIFCSIIYLNNPPQEIRNNLSVFYSVGIMLTYLVYFFYCTSTTCRTLIQIIEDQ